MYRRAHTTDPSFADIWDGARSDYAAAKSSRFRRRRTGLAPHGSSADYHYRNDADYLKIMEYARDMDRNDAIVGSTVDRAVINTVQNGFLLDPQTGDDKLDHDLWQRWNEWAIDPEQCDVAGEMTFAEIEYLTARHVLVDGDVFVLPLKSGHLQLAEGHRCRTPRNTTKNVVNGVLLDAHRKRLEYWFTKDDIDPNAPLIKVTDVTPVAARGKDGQKQVFQVYSPKRASQTRGVSAFAPIFDTAGMCEDINFAKMVQQQVVSCFAVFREREKGMTTPGNVGTGGSQTIESMGDGTTRTLEGIGPGMQVKGLPGEKLQGFSPGVPNAEYFQHVRLMLQIIGANLGLPLVVMLMDGSETNFSGWRGAVDQAKMGWRRNQKSLMARLHCPTYRWKVRQWIAEDAPMRFAATRAGVDIFAHNWNPPTWPYIEPFKDAQADLLRIRNGLISPRRLHAENGRDYEDIADETITDNSFAIRKAMAAALDINGEFKALEQPVHWRDLLSLPAPGGVVINYTEPLNENQSGESAAKPGTAGKNAA